jgi:DNA-binding IclR family transcriptional regulator
MPAETILRLLENGKWHYLKEIKEKTQLNSGKVENVTKFLAKYNFVKLDETEQKVKLDSPMNRFLKRLRQLDKEENI